MIQARLLHFIAYCWIVFGAYWVAASFRRKVPDPAPRTGRNRLRFAALAITFAVLFFERHKIPPSLLIVLCVFWGALSLYWASSPKSASSGEFRFYRPLRLLVLAATFALLFWEQTSIGPLGKHVLEPNNAIAVIGFVFAVVGLGIAVWARIHLGSYWSDKIVLQDDHQLIRTGPYAAMRHPIYSGVLLGVLGTALIVDQWRGVLAFAILFTNYAVKAKREERILAKRFSREFQQHASRTGFLLPRLRG